jgi:hypothetical protein
MATEYTPNPKIQCPGLREVAGHSRDAFQQRLNTAQDTANHPRQRALSAIHLGLPRSLATRLFLGEISSATEFRPRTQLLHSIYN